MVKSVDARAGAARVIAQVAHRRRSLADVLPPVLQGLADAQQRALLQELAYGTLRWYFQLDAILQQLLDKPLKASAADVHGLLLAGLYQLDHMAVPQRVAVHETVQAVHALNKAWASGLVNAVLRNYQRNGPDLHQAIAGDTGACYAHPDWLVARIQADWPNDWAEILQANNTRPPLGLRINRRRVTRDEYLELLALHRIEAVPLSATDQGIMLTKPVAVDALPGFAEGVVSVQDGAAQLAAGLLDLAPGQSVLDACAAPGGKTAHMLELQPNLAALTALDIDAGRLHRVEENLARLDLQARIMHADAGAPDKWWDGHQYDRILLDTPCSATGVIRRHPDIKLLRQPGDIAALCVRQAHLLEAVWPLLAARGMLLYCTCSVLTDENSRQVERFLATHADAVEVPIRAPWGRACTAGRQLLPGEEAMDGFYFACLRKSA
ncbi:MAG: 16S rRNA (cytosine(967)-C(5))-methyltransferase RsmB [Gammaproteobacteria bacterium]